MEHNYFHLVAYKIIPSRLTGLLKKPHETCHGLTQSLTCDNSREICSKLIFIEEFHLEEEQPNWYVKLYGLHLISY